MKHPPHPDHVEIDAGGEVVLAAEDAALLLGVPLADFLADLRSGVVFSVIERGEGEDAGRIRATLRRRGAEARLVIEAGTGRVLEVTRPGGR